MSVAKEGGLGGGGSTGYGELAGFTQVCLQIMICKVWKTMVKHIFGKHQKGFGFFRENFILASS